jgi:hypothetical protein
MLNAVFIVLAIVGALLLAAKCSHEASEQALPSQAAKWNEDFHRDITAALIAKDVRGCGQYVYREVGPNTGEYLVRCTPDGVTWTEYYVRTRTGDVVPMDRTR